MQVKMSARKGQNLENLYSKEPVRKTTLNCDRYKALISPGATVLLMN